MSVHFVVKGYTGGKGWIVNHFNDKGSADNYCNILNRKGFEICSKLIRYKGINKNGYKEQLIKSNTWDKQMMFDSYVYYKVIKLEMERMI